MRETIEQIVKASKLPISIIIIGIGDSPELEKMEALDSDSRLLKDYNGNEATRDIVQFVKFNDFSSASKTTLEEEVLKEVPNQI